MLYRLLHEIRLINHPEYKQSTLCKLSILVFPLMILPDLLAQASVWLSVILKKNYKKLD